MEFRVVDFEKLTHHYKNYQDGLKKIEEEKKLILQKVEPFRKEMQNIVADAQNGVVVDKAIEQERYEKFQKLQQEMLSIDKDAKFHLGKMSDALTKEIYAELEKTVSTWSIENSIDIIVGKLEVVYAKDEFEVTNQILDIFKENGLYVDDLMEERLREKESV